MSPALTYPEVATRLIDNGYAPIPVHAETKAAAITGFPEFARRVPSVRKAKGWGRKWPDASTGLVCGALVVLDLDIMDRGKLLDVVNLACLLLGETPLQREGMPPKRALLYRAAPGTVRTKGYRLAAGGEVAVIGSGKQCVAFGIHPNTGKPYAWLGETPLEVPLSDLPEVTADNVETFLSAARKIAPAAEGMASRKAPAGTDQPRRARRQGEALAVEWGYDGRGRVCDGRDVFLRDCVLKALSAAERRGDRPDADRLAADAWKRFSSAADLSRPKGSGGGAWSYDDALTKAAYALSRYERGELILKVPRAGARPKKGFWTKAQKDAFLSKVAADRKLPPAAPAVAAASMSDLNRDGRDIMAPGVARLMEATGLAERTVQAARARLVARGYWKAGGPGAGKLIGSGYRSRPYFPNGAVLRENWQPFEKATKPPLKVQGSCTQYPYTILSPFPGVPVPAANDASAATAAAAKATAVAGRAYRFPPLAQRSLLDMAESEVPTVAAADLDGWRAGLMPRAVARAVLHELERRGVTQDELAAVLGLSRPQLTNGLRRRFGLGNRPTVAVKAWLLEAVA